MPSATEPRRTPTVIMLVMMFLIADLFVPQAVPEWQELDEQPVVFSVTTSDAPTYDTVISDTNPNTVGNQSDQGDVGISEFGQESRLLFTFPMNLTSSSSIQSATLDLQCTTDSIAATQINIYTAHASAWNDSEATWMQSDTNLPWDAQGADGASDRGAWEPPFRASANGTFSLNVTAHAQQAAASNNSELNILVSGNGALYTCDLLESQAINNRPSLTVVSSTTAAGDGGSMSSVFAEDGQSLMTDDFILTADRAPTIAYTSLVGQAVEYQFSLDSNFKSELDLEWHYSSLWNSFTATGASGSYQIPSGEQFDNGSEVHYRYRSMDSTGTLGTWTEESFLLPAHDVTDNGDNTASLSVDVDDLGLPIDFIEDTYANQLSRNAKYGTSSTMVATLTSNKESMIHFRMDLSLLGLPANATIIDANVELQRQSSSGSTMLSMHEMESNVWIEEEVTWNRGSNGNNWDDGGREYASTATDTGLNGSQTASRFEFSFTDSLQQWVESSTNDPADYLIVARGDNGAYSSTGTVSTTFHSSEASIEADQPSVEITYAWGTGATLPSVSLTAPAQGEAVWNQSGHNFSANTTPSIEWDGTASASYDIAFQMATDEQFRNRVWDVKTSSSSAFTPSDGIINLTGTDALDVGNMYFWRMAHLDSDGRYGGWTTSNFLVSSAESTWLGGDRYEFRMSNGNGTVDGLYPACMDTFIDSGTPNQNYDDESKLLVSYNTYPFETVALMSCDLKSNLLPAGYAVESANLEFTLGSNPFNAPTLAVWENTQNNWTADGATWTTYDGVNNWGMAGAKGSERGSLLDSVNLGTTFSSGSTVEWNVTLGVQNAMRENRSVNFMLGILGVGSGQTRDVQLFPGSGAVSTRPELTFVYVPGSNAVPNDPSPMAPLNGSWSIGSGVDLTPLDQPTLEWNFNSNLSVGGYAVQLDTSSTFDSSDLQVFTSWNDAGFDLANNTYTPATGLEEGTTWHWRVRAISATNQIGNWSDSFHFLLPDLTTWQTCPDGSCAAVELHHREAMPALNLPNFEDTYVYEAGAGSSSPHDDDTQMKVGAIGYDRQAVSLIRIPLNAVPQPANARVTDAGLNLFSEFGSSTGEPLAVRPVLQNWNGDANDTTYDGTNNWSALGGRDIGVDAGPYVDLQTSVSAAWMTWDVTEAVQAALDAGSSSLSLMVYASNDITSWNSGANVITFTSTEGISSNRPWLNLTWTNGTAAVPSTTGTNSGPANASILWNATSHAVLPEYAPMLSWTLPASATAPAAWRVMLFADADDDMAGRTVYDSRVNPSAFDLINLTFTPPTEIQNLQTVRWTVQPIDSGMIGPQSNSTIFYIPSVMSGEVDANHAWIDLQDGSMVADLNYPSLTLDTALDSGNTQGNNGASGYLAVGQSPTSSTLRSSTLLSIDFSTLPMPAVYEINNASLQLSAVAGSGEVFVTVSEMITSWDEASSWAYPGNNTTSWVGAGAYHSADSHIPETEGFWMNGTSVYDINVTAMLQHAILRGQESLNILIQAEEVDGTVDGVYYISSSENTVQADRPLLSFTYGTSPAWVPSAPTNMLPADGSTLWNLSATRPSGADEVYANWTSLETNQTQWVLCGASEPRMIEDLECFDSASAADGVWPDTTWDPTNLTMGDTNVTKGDFWNHWRVRADQDGRIGQWSSVHKFRIPENQGYDDGDGNQSLGLYRGSIFDETGLLPSVPDAEISSSISTNIGSAQTINLGTSSSGSGQSSIMFEYDLSAMPWPAAMTPTSMLLGLYRHNVVGTSATTVSAHACDSFTESSVTWNNTPTCSPSEITRSTLTLSPSTGWIEWDLTSLAQSNVANGNMTMTVMLEVVGTPFTNHQFYSSDYHNESLRPRLVVEYIDNVDGIQPPSQPSLTYPTDGKVLYNTSGVVLEPDASPVLTWAPSTGATGYIVTIANQSGVYKFRSWEGTAITGTSFRFPTSLDTGEVFQWWVQGVNQSIPGPSSSRWSFAIGDPAHTDNGDMTYTYSFQTGSEVTQFGHSNIRETHLSEADGDSNFGDSDIIEVGTYFGQNSGQKAYMTFALDNSQVPLPAHASIHSASLGLYIDSWIAAGGANAMTFNVHRITNAQWSQSASSWNNASSGVSWGAAGMQAGVDYDATPVSSFVETDMTDNRWIWFDIGAQGMLIDNDNAWLIIGTPNRGDMIANFIASESMIERADQRPIILLNHTDVTTIDVTPTAPTTNADTSISFAYASYNHLSMAVNAPIVWSASNGSISTTGIFTPYASGQHTVSACFGLVCAVETVTVTPGAPTTLVATGSASEITADQTMTITAQVVDQFGNVVPNEIITYTPSNGSMDVAQPNLFNPYAVGLQTIVVGWNGQTVDVDVLVTTGVATYFTLEGCSGTNPAGVWCSITHTLYDQFDNEIVDVSQAGSLTWTVENGNYSTLNEEYFPDHVGVWMLNLTSTSGAEGQLAIVVGHGEMDRLELDLSATEITADDRIYINTTRIDVRGNRLPVYLPSQNWTKTSDGILTVGGPAIWDPVSRGEKILEARYEDKFTQVSITVEQGDIVTLVLVVANIDSVGDTFQLTADDSIDVKVKATDQKGNRWSINANWTLVHATWSDQSILEGADLANDEVTFQPYMSSATAYTIFAVYDDGQMIHEVSLFVEVTQGDLISTTVSAIASDGTSGESFALTADEHIDFSASLEDQDTNAIDSSMLKWVLIDTDNDVMTDITSQLIANSMRWEATDVGNFTISGFAISNAGYNISDSVSISVLHGVAVSVSSTMDTTAQDAGKEISIQITGTDADGNTFPQTVEWTENNSAVSDISAGEGEGAYTYFARTAGPHTLEFSAGQASDSLDLSVAAQRTVSSITVELSSDTIDQLGSFTVTVLAFDAYDNPIQVPASTNVDSTGRAEVLAQGQGVWKVVTLDSGAQEITVTSGKVSESLEYEVVGNVGGFFKSGGPLYYVGAVLLGIIIVVILGLLVVTLRGGGEDYDDYDEDDEYDDEPVSRPAAGPTGPAPAAGPTGPAPGPSGPAPTPEPEPEEDTSWMMDHRVDDDGTEWAEDENGTWWYRQPNETEWSEWAE